MNRKREASRSEAPEHIRSILDKLWKNRNWTGNPDVSLLVHRWLELVGPQIGERSQPESLRDGVLWVKVENSVWLTHLRFLEEELRQKLNRELSSLAIKQIRFRQGPLQSLQTVPAAASRSRPNQPHQTLEIPLPPLNPEQRDLLEEISDRDLRQALKRLLRRQQKRFHR